MVKVDQTSLLTLKRGCFSSEQGPVDTIPFLSPFLSVGQQPTKVLVQFFTTRTGRPLFLYGGNPLFSIKMPQLDKFTYFTQFFWSCLFLFTFYIPICNDGDGVLGISRILKLRNKLVSHRGNNIRSNDPNSLEEISGRRWRGASEEGIVKKNSSRREYSMMGMKR